MNREEIEKLLDDGLAETKLAYSNAGEGVIYIAPVEDRDSAVVIPVRDKNMGWHKAHPKVYMALIERFNAAPDLARTALALMTQLEDAKAAQALVVERAVKEGMRIAAVVPLHQAQQSMDDAIRALADPTGVEALAALRAERDGAVAAEKQRDTELQEQHRIRKAWADRALAAEAQVGALREALKMSSEGWRNALEAALASAQGGAADA